MIKPEEVIAFLNTLVAIDPCAMTDLVNTRVPCSEAIANHPTVQVAPAAPDAPAPPYRVGLLGILNGLCGARADGWGFIAARLDDNDQVIEFILTPDAHAPDPLIDVPSGTQV